MTIISTNNSKLLVVSPWKPIVDFEIFEGKIKLRIVSKLTDSFASLFENFKEAYFVLKNTNKLTTKEFEELSIDMRNVDDIEVSIIKEINNWSNEEKWNERKKLLKCYWLNKKIDFKPLTFDNKI